MYLPTVFVAQRSFHFDGDNLSPRSAIAFERLSLEPGARSAHQDSADPTPRKKSRVSWGPTVEKRYYPTDEGGMGKEESVGNAPVSSKYPPRELIPYGEQVLKTWKREDRKREWPYHPRPLYTREATFIGPGQIVNVPVALPPHVMLGGYGLCMSFPPGGDCGGMPRVQGVTMLLDTADVEYPIVNHNPFGITLPAHLQVATLYEVGNHRVWNSRDQQRVLRMEEDQSSEVGQEEAALQWGVAEALLAETEGVPFYAHQRQRLPARSQTTVLITPSAAIKEYATLCAPSELVDLPGGVTGAHVVNRVGPVMTYLMVNAGPKDVILEDKQPLGVCTAVQEGTLVDGSQGDPNMYVKLVPVSTALLAEAQYAAEPTTEGRPPLHAQAQEKMADRGHRTLRSDPSKPVPFSKLPKEALEELARWNITEATLTDDQKLALMRILQRNAAAFAKDDMDLGCCNVEKCHIDTGTAAPIHCNPYRIAVTLREVLRKELYSLLEQGIIEPSVSPWAAPITYVPKQDGSWRLCVDFRKINVVIKPCVYPLPRIEDIFDSLEGACYFSAMDLAKGFWQIELDDESKEKAAFTTVYGQFQYRRLPFGLASSPGTFQKVLNTVLAGLTWVHAMVYLDDILIFTKTFEEHMKVLDDVLQRLINANLRVKLKKCEWARSELKYLGHIINAKGRAPDPAKVTAISQLQPPRCVRDLEMFLGKVGYYHKFIPDFANVARPLNQLKRKNAMWDWGEPQQKAFEQLKISLCSAPVLRHPDFAKPFVLQTDASGYGLGAVLSQNFDDGEHPIAYASRTMLDRETRHAIVEKEALAIYWAINHFRHYLLGTKFLVQTDAKALTALRRIKDHNTRLEKISLKLQMYDFEIEYRPGIKNQNADLLSRYPSIPLPSKKVETPKTLVLVAGEATDDEDDMEDDEPAPVPRRRRNPHPSREDEPMQVDDEEYLDDQPGPAYPHLTGLPTRGPMYPSKGKPKSRRHRAIPCLGLRGYHLRNGHL